MSKTIAIASVTWIPQDDGQGGTTEPHNTEGRGRVTRLDVADVDEAVRQIKNAGLTFSATGTAWAADPDGSRLIDYTTGEREAVSAHLEGDWTFLERDEIYSRVG